MKIGPLRKEFGTRVVLDIQELELQKNRIYALLGANGSGKSTFCRILAGALENDAGRVFPGEKPKVICQPQHPYVFRLSAEKNLRIGGKIPGREEQLLRGLHLEELRKAGAVRLSGGETARMALGRTLMSPCDLLILDEPTAAMDMESTALAEKAILEYREMFGAAVLIVTHSIGQARRIGDQVLFFRSGRLAEAGECPARLDRPETEEFRRFLEYFG